MTKLDKAIEIIRGWSDEELKEYIVLKLCPHDFTIKDYLYCGLKKTHCKSCWNEEAAL